MAFSVSKAGHAAASSDQVRTIYLLSTATHRSILPNPFAKFLPWHNSPFVDPPCICSLPSTKTLCRFPLTSCFPSLHMFSSIEPSGLVCSFRDPVAASPQSCLTRQPQPQPQPLVDHVCCISLCIAL